MKSVRFGKNSQESISSSENIYNLKSAELQSLDVYSAGEEDEGKQMGRPIHDQKLMVENAMQALKSIKHVRQKKHVPNAIDEGNRFQGWNYVYDLIGF